MLRTQNLIPGLALLCLLSVGQLVFNVAHADVTASCPPVGVDIPGCALVIDITAASGGAATQFSVTAGPSYALGPYDGPAGGDDTLVGVINNSGVLVSSLFLDGGTTGIFAFDGDGACTFGVCFGVGSDSTGYAPSVVSFSGYSSGTSGTVNFLYGGLENGESTWFSLEEPLTTTSIVNGTAPEIDALSASSAFTLLIGGLLILRGRRSRSGSLVAA